MSRYEWNHYTDYLADQAATCNFARCLAGSLITPALFYFKGEIGAGKTTLVRSLLQQLGVNGRIKSPSFALVESYVGSGVEIYHFDLYRLTAPEELEYLAWRDCFGAAALCCVEWPQRAGDLLPTPDLEIELEILDNGRQINCYALSSRGDKMLVHLMELLEC